MKTFRMAGVLLAVMAVVGIRAETPKAKAKEPGCECELVTAYVPISKALAADDLKAAKVAAVELGKQGEGDGMKTIVEGGQSLSKGEDLSAGRAAFKPLRKEGVSLVGDYDFFVVKCPMG